MSFPLSNDQMIVAYCHGYPLAAIPSHWQLVHLVLVLDSTIAKQEASRLRHGLERQIWQAQGRHRSGENGQKLVLTGANWCLKMGKDWPFSGLVKRQGTIVLANESSIDRGCSVATFVKKTGCFFGWFSAESMESMGCAHLGSVRAPLVGQPVTKIEIGNPPVVIVIATSILLFQKSVLWSFYTWHQWRFGRLAQEFTSWVPSGKLT